MQAKVRHAFSLEMRGRDPDGNLVESDSGVITSTPYADYLYVSAGCNGNRLVIYDSHSLKKVESVSMKVPAGVFSHMRARTVVIGLESELRR